MKKTQHFAHYLYLVLMILHLGSYETLANDGYAPTSFLYDVHSDGDNQYSFLSNTSGLPYIFVPEILPIMNTLKGTFSYYYGKEIPIIKPHLLFENDPFSQNSRPALSYHQQFFIKESQFHFKEMSFKFFCNDLIAQKDIIPTEKTKVFCFLQDKTNKIYQNLITKISDQKNIPPIPPRIIILTPSVHNEFATTMTQISNHALNTNSHSSKQRYYYTIVLSSDLVERYFKTNITTLLFTIAHEMTHLLLRHGENGRKIVRYIATDTTSEVFKSSIANANNKFIDTNQPQTKALESYLLLSRQTGDIKTDLNLSYPLSTIRFPGTHLKSLFDQFLFNYLSQGLDDQCLGEQYSYLIKELQNLEKSQQFDQSQDGFEEKNAYAFKIKSIIDQINELFERNDQNHCRYNTFDELLKHAIISNDDLRNRLGINETLSNNQISQRLIQFIKNNKKDKTRNLLEAAAKASPFASKAFIYLIIKIVEENPFITYLDFFDSNTIWSAIQKVFQLFKIEENRRAQLLNDLLRSNDINFSSLRYISYEDEADILALSVIMDLFYADPQDIVASIKDQLTPEDAQYCDQLIQKDIEPWFGPLENDYHSTCWKIWRALKLLSPSFKN